MTPERPLDTGYYFSSKQRENMFKRLMTHEHEENDTDWQHIHLPFSDVSEWLPDNNVYKETADTFNLYRLAGIKSLSFLAYRFDLTGNQDLNLMHTFNHDRYSHSLMVGLLMEKVMRRNKFPENTVQKGIIEGLLHDNGTNALGDAIKSLDPQNLDEETNWHDTLTTKGLSVLGKYGVTVPELDKVFKNEGLMGKLLDYTDRITYTMYDVDAINDYYRITPEEIYRDIPRTTQADTAMGNIYRDILIDEKSGEPYFNDPGRLQRFLRARALMFYNLYKNPLTAGRDWLVAKFVEPFYTSGEPTKEKPLTPKTLRQMDDMQVMNFLTKHYDMGRYNDFFKEIALWAPSYIEVATREDAETEQKKLSQRKNIAVFDTVEITGFRPATHYLTRNDNGDVLPLKNAFPEGAEELEDIAEATKGTYVLYANIEKDTPMNRIIRKVVPRGKVA